jgi:hypothetical protein
MITVDDLRRILGDILEQNRDGSKFSKYEKHESTLMPLTTKKYLSQKVSPIRDYSSSKQTQRVILRVISHD